MAPAQQYHSSARADNVMGNDAHMITRHRSRSFKQTSGSRFKCEAVTAGVVCVLVLRLQEQQLALHMT